MAQEEAIHDASSKRSTPWTPPGLIPPPPYLVAASWIVLAWVLLMEPAEPLGLEVGRSWPLWAPRWLPPIKAGLIFPIGAVALASARPVGWVIALVVAVVGAFIHPFRCC